MKWVNRHTFRKVVAQTNIFDAAIGFAVAVSFIKVINTFVTAILAPIIGSLIGGKSLSQFQLQLKLFNGDTPLFLLYGDFLDVCIEFFFIVIIVYWTARVVLRIKKKGADTIQKMTSCLCCHMTIPSKAKKCPYCHTELETKPETQIKSSS